MPSEAFDRYANAVEICSGMAKRELASVVAKLDTSKKKAARDALLAVVPAIVAKWGGLAATAAAEYYENEREQAVGGRYTALLADDEPLENIEESVRYACGHLFTKGEGDAR